MGQRIEDDLDEEEVNFIYVNPSCKDRPQRVEAIKLLIDRYQAKVIYNQHIDMDVLLMTEEKLTEEELLTAGSDDPEN